MTGDMKTKVNDDHTAIWCRVTWKIILDNRTGGELTEAQCKALENYCEKKLPSHIAASGVDALISIDCCKIYRNQNNDTLGHRDLLCYDADTGELYDERDIFDGKHEIRVKPTDGPQTK